jgi:DNA ligase D-like protein (predicted 3'-phosphoesterase)
MRKRSRLKAYRKKRDFRGTPEPQGAVKTHTGRRFVIQKHAARALHYDFRLEIDGLLVSWAVPKGLSTDPREKRLAIRTEDHPLAYADFEGVIPKGHYGAGTVMVWDRGDYRNLRAHKGKDDRADMSSALDEGLVEVWLNGKKLKGGYALKRLRRGTKEQWLVIKMDDDQADARRRPANTQTESVKTGREMDEIADKAKAETNTS